MNAQDTVIGGDVFNARDLSSHQVAARFIAPPAFRRLLSVSHCILEGPRGSGKTTLLRMLTPEAFALWSDHTNGGTIPFIGIFVPADVRWAKQMTARLVRVTDTVTRETIQQAVFSVAVNLAFVETLEACSSLASKYDAKHPDLFFNISKEARAGIVERLSQLWQLSVPVPSFSGLRLALRMRQLELGAVALQLSEGISISQILSEKVYIASTWLDNIVSAVESTNEVLERPQQKWAVLLDELEIVPPEILGSIVPALRSTSRHLRFKLALSPTGFDLISRDDDGRPTDDNDYRSIRLWYDKRKDARLFSETLFRAVLQLRAGVQPELSLVDILNRSTTQDESDEADDLPVEENSKDNGHKERITAFVRLYERDESFKALLDTRKIDPYNPPISDSDPNGSWVRKITPIARHRAQELDRFEQSKGRAKRRGGQRGQQLYLGYPSLLDLTEGNPRWVLTLAEALVAQSEEARQPLSAQGIQTAVVKAYVENFVAKLKVYPTSLPNAARRWTTFQFIEALGETIANAIYDGSFNADPSMSFAIDGKALQQYGEYIRTAIDLGALVIVRKSGAAPITQNNHNGGLEGARVRLSYRLAPHFRLPLRSTKEISMSSALKAGELLTAQQDVNDLTTSTELISQPKAPFQPRLI